MTVASTARVVTETLDRVKDVAGRPLERFGEKDGLVVTWW
jgi:hypothetical protein